MEQTVIFDLVENEISHDQILHILIVFNVFIPLSFKDAKVYVS